MLSVFFVQDKKDVLIYVVNSVDTPIHFYVTLMLYQISYEEEIEDIMKSPKTSSGVF